MVNNPKIEHKFHITRRIRIPPGLKMHRFCDILHSMNILLAHIGSSPRAQDPFQLAVADYLKRCSGVAHCSSEAFRTEAAFFDWLGRQKSRTEPAVWLLDGRGKQMSSEALADWIGKRRNDGTQLVVFAIGPADGWSEEVRSAKHRSSLLSLGSMTLAHQLARLVMAEQIYRACTILTGHPYHKGH